MMANTLSEALLVLESWNIESDDLTLQQTKPLVNDFCENRLKSDQVSKFYCTVLDVEVSEDQKKDAESVCVTLIPAIRSEWLDPQEDPPGVHWLVHHDKYYPGLKELQHIKHVVSFFPKTKNAAAAIHKSLYRQAQLHQLSPPERNGVLFTFDIWNKDACGLTNYHRTIIHDFCVRKAKAGEQLIAYSTVIDLKLSEDQKTDAKKCGVILIPSKRKERGTMKKDLPKVDWLLKHEIHYPGLGKLKNIKYVVGYAPKTGWAAADIKETLFPDAKLVLINHAFPEKTCLFKMDDDEAELEEDMLKMASLANMLFSIGPKIYEYFKNAYRAKVDGRKLSDIPHEEILPKPGQVYFDGELVNGTDTDGARTILTYGQLDTQEALKTCEVIAVSIGNVANTLKESHKPCPDWKIKGTSKEDGNKTRQYLNEKLNSAHVMPKLYPTYSVQKLLRVLQQSHLCLPPSCYNDYSFEGLEAMAAGLPTRVQDDSHIASMIKKHFPMHTDLCVMTLTSTYIEDKISRCLTYNTEAFHQARKLREDFGQSEVVTESLAKFAAVFKEDKGTKRPGKHKGHGKLQRKGIDQHEDTQQGVSETKGITSKQTTTVYHGITDNTDTTEERETADTTEVHPGMSTTEDTVTTGTKAVHPGMSATEDTVTTGTTAVHHGMSDTEDTVTTETTAVQHWMSVMEDKETTETTTVHHGMSVSEGRETTAVHHGMSATEGMETTAVYHGMSATEDTESTETTAVHHGMSVTEVKESTETTAMHPGKSVMEDKETTEATAEHHGMSVTKDMETTAAHHGMLVTEDMETTEATAVHHGMSVREDTDTIEITDTAAVQHGMSVTEDVETTEATAVHHGMSVTEDMETTEATAVQHGMSVTACIETTDTAAVQHWMSFTEDMETTEATVVHHGMSVTGGMETTETGEGTAMQPPSSDTGGGETTDVITIQSLVVRDKETNSKNSKQSETFLDKESASKEQRQTKQGHHRKRKKINESDKTRNPKMPRIEIRSSQPEQSDPRKTDRKESGPLKTNQTKYKTQRRDISTNPSNQSPSDSSTAEESTDSDAFMVHVGLDEESYQQQMRDLDSQVLTGSVREKKEQLKAAWKKIQAEVDKSELEAITNNNSVLKVDQNCQDNFGEVTVTSMKQDSLAISLDLPTLYNLYRLKQTCLSGSFPDSFKPLLITNKMREEADKVGLQLKLKATYDQARFDELELFFINRDGGGLEPVKMYHDVIEGEDDEEILIDDEDTDQKSDTMAAGRVDSSSQTEQGQLLEDVKAKSKMERGTLESQLKEAKEEKAMLEERCKELTQKLESTEQSLVNQRIGNSVERDKLQSELEENQKLVKELQDKVGELERQLEQSDLKKSGDKGDWSLTLVNGQHQDQGQKFKSPRGLAFHHDKLVVCDSGNNIVQILNKDYTCDKILGSFDGQFAKPFRPKSVAISRFNHYFILDDENKQIIVCDENGKIIEIITLPENTEVVWDIALMDDFVLVTLRLTSPDTRVRSVDSSDSLVKYTQSGEYLKKVNGQISGQGQFDWPVSVVVNSNNVIMVYDIGNGCIKCFDSDLNFLHQFGQSQIPRGIVGYYGYPGYLAVDGDDNVYVCDYFTDSILKYRCDGKWICDLFKGDLSKPRYIAVMGDKIGVEEKYRDQIKIFSK